MQHAFAAALTFKTNALCGVSPARFDIYRNNRLSALIDALSTGFPATERIVGEAFFRAMAREFVAAHPPCSPVLMDYGAELPAFMARFAPLAELAYLADVARLELAHTRAYHAADAPALGPDALMQLADTSRLAIHPSVSLIDSPYPIATIWTMNTSGEPAPIEDWRGENVLVLRTNMAVHVHTLEAGAVIFLEQLQQGVTLAGAAAKALHDAQDCALGPLLAFAFSNGVFTQIL